MTAAADPARSRAQRFLREAWAIVALPLLSIALALLVGSFVIIFSEALVPGRRLDPFLPLVAYSSLFEGAVGSPNAIVDSLVNTAPLVLAGLSVAIGFKAGLFNIGGAGQYMMGALGSVAAGVAVADQPPLLAIPVAVGAGMLTGAMWGFIPGFLKAISGAHEVVTTIMLNYVAGKVLAALVSGPLKVPLSPSPITHDVGSAGLPIIIGRNGHLGILIAVVAVLIVWWLLYRTTLGFEIRTVGANPDAARYAGMRPRRLVMLTMTLCGVLAGLAGASTVLGVTHSMTSSFGGSVGFDAIAVALLARSNPLAIPAAAFLFGGMRAGSNLMQTQALIPVELVDVLQATILLFLVASPLLRRVFRLRGVRTGLGSSDSIARTYGAESVR